MQNLLGLIENKPLLIIWKCIYIFAMFSMIPVRFVDLFNPVHHLIILGYLVQTMSFILSF